MSQKRTSSKIKQKQVETKMLQQQTKKMQQKLAALKLQVQEQKKLKQANNHETTLTKWKKATNPEAPLKDYAKKILADRKQALNKFGINEKKITGSKSFEPVLSKIRQQKRQQQEKDPSRIPKFQINSIVDNKNSLAENAEDPTKSIQNNFFKSKIKARQLVHRKNLQEFLQQNFIPQYLPILKQNQINELEDLYHLSKQKMTEMGIKPGHQAKIIKRIKQQIQGKTQQKKQTANTEQKSEEKVSFGYGDGDINEYTELNHNQQRQKQAYNQNNQAGLEDQEQENSDFEQEMEDQVIITMPQMSQFSLQTNSVQPNQLAQQSQSFNCFQCYRKTANTQDESSDGRRFCSKVCLNKYLQQVQKKCPECEQLFFKFDGYFQQGLWFCSIKCSPNREKIQQMFIQWANQAN